MDSPIQRTPEEIADFYRRVMRPIFSPLLRYHQFRLDGAERVPERALLVATHAAMTYDLILVLVEFERVTGRVIHGLADDMWFEKPVLRHTIGRLGAGIGSVPAAPASARAMLRAGHIVGVAPGGSRELLRSARDRHQIRWARRRGFVRLALETGSPIVLSTCPRADLVFDVRPSRLTDAVFARTRIPLPMLRGRGGAPFPRAEALTHYFSDPIAAPPLAGATPSDPEIDGFHAQLCAAMEAHIARSCEREGLR